MSDLCMQLQVGSPQHTRGVLTVTYDSYHAGLTASTERRITRYIARHRTFPWRDADAVQMLLDALNTMESTIRDIHTQAKETK
ncbi:hypothetical protein [Bifidobacterium animalis]|uniref:hypothetical protein n=1 Tax=Bifidobacterium animalis TaxID=28025 RepID=UPI003F927131